MASSRDGVKPFEITRGNFCSQAFMAQCECGGIQKGAISEFDCKYKKYILLLARPTWENRYFEF
jgi:hypothetical protein